MYWRNDEKQCHWLVRQEIFDGFAENLPVQKLPILSFLLDNGGV
jgi:hypothetical protein